MECKGCGWPVARESRFCGNCGAGIGPAGAEKRKIVTILFCDLVDSTALTATQDVEASRRFVLRHFELMRSCVARHGGTVEKYIGDAVMAVFGVPRASEDDALRAVRAALDMVAATAEFTGGTGSVALQVRIGIATGEVVAAAVSGPDRDALVSGLCVNVAARLQSHAAPDGVLVTDDTFALVQHAVEAQRVPPLVLKGVPHAVPAWSITGLRTDRTARSRQFDVPLQGRQRELDELLVILAEVRSQRDVRQCTVLGDPGIGKTRLAREFITAIDHEGLAVGTGRCQAYGDGTYAALIQAVESLPAPRGKAGPPTRADLGVAEWASVLRTLLSAPTGPPAAVLVLDDLHWSAPELLDAIEQLAHVLRGLPVLIVELARPELLDRRPAWAVDRPGSMTLALHPLEPDVSAGLALAFADVTAHAGTRSPAVADIVRSAGGNPFFIEQLVVSTGGLDAGVLPPTVQTLMTARLDRLEELDRSVLEVAAVLGLTFVVTALAELVRRHVRELDVTATIHRLIDNRLIESADPEHTCRFVNEIVRDAAYAAIPKRQRVHWHRVAGEWLVQARPSAMERIADHLLAEVSYRRELGLTGSDLDTTVAEAGRWLQRAGRAALRSGDVPRARRLLEAALAQPLDLGAPARLAASADLLDTRIIVGDAAGAEQLIRQLMERPEVQSDPALQAHLSVQRSVLTLAGGGLDEVEQAAQAALEVFEPACDDLGVCRARLRLAQVHQSRGSYRSAAAMFETALTAARLVAAELEQATAEGGLALCLYHGPTPAAAAIRRGDALLRGRSNASLTRAAVCCPLALLHGMRSEFDEGTRLLAEARTIFDDTGHTAALATLPLFHGLLSVMADDLAAADAWLTDAEVASMDIGDQHQAAQATTIRARIAIDRGSHDRGEQLLRPLISSTSGTPADVADRFSLQARLRAHAGDRAGAELLCQDAWSALGGTDSPESRAAVLLDRARVLELAGRRGDARAAGTAALANYAAKQHLAGRIRAGDVLRRLEE